MKRPLTRFLNGASWVKQIEIKWPTIYQEKEEEEEVFVLFLVDLIVQINLLKKSI